MLFGVAVGTFIGNWLVVPKYFPNRTHKDGFWIGLISGGLIAAVACFV